MQEQDINGQPTTGSTTTFTAKLLSSQDEPTCYSVNLLSSRSKLTPEEFFSYTSTIERETLRNALAQAVLVFVNQDKPVYLESFGIVIPKISTQERIRFSANKILMQVETSRALYFEKCGELVSFHRDKFAGIVETKDICACILSFSENLRCKHWDEKILRLLLRSFIKLIRLETISNGISKQLEQLGCFFALHNRQGQSSEDWFAGADIFLDSSYHKTLFVEPQRMQERPTLSSSWELLEAAFGPPANQFSLDLVKELTEMGYDPKIITDGLASNERKISVAVFIRRDDSPTLIYATDGLRNYGLKSQVSIFGTEFIFQLCLNSLNGCLPTWPLRPITMGWILMQSAKSKTVRAGKGMACGASLIYNDNCELQNIFTTEFAAIKSEQLSNEGPFYYTNLIGISSDEAQLAASSGAEYLSKILEYKGLDQITKPKRSSVVARSYIDLTKLS